MEDKALKITAGSAVILAIVSIVMQAGLIGEDVYVCLDNELAMKCDRLSKVNLDGLQTRCYYTHNSTETYKICKTGWIKYKQPKRENKLNMSGEIFLVCEKTSDFIRECQIINKNESLYVIRND